MSEIRGTHASRIIYTQVISNFIEALYSNENFVLVEPLRRPTTCFTHCLDTCRQIPTGQIFSTIQKLEN